METASRLLYGEIPYWEKTFSDMEDALSKMEDALSMRISTRFRNGTLLIHADAQSYVARPVDSIDPDESVAVFEDARAALNDAIGPHEVLAELENMAIALIGRGDYDAASRIELLMTPYEKWLEKNRVFALERETPAGRLVLTGADGEKWIAIRAADI